MGFLDCILTFRMIPVDRELKIIFFRNYFHLKIIMERTVSIGVEVGVIQSDEEGKLLKVAERIMLIAPYLEMAEEALKLNVEFNYNVLVRHAYLSECLNLLDEANERQIDVIVSRGGVALKCAQRQADIPVVEIPITGFDILEALQKAKGSYDEVAIVGFGNIVQGAARVAQILSIPGLRVIYRQDEGDCVEKIAFLKSQGIRLVIGDALVVRVAQEMGMESVLIRSNREGILAAYQEATRVANIKNQERLQREQMKAVMEYTRHGVITVDGNGLITAINGQAEQLIHKRREEVIARPCQIAVPYLKVDETLTLGRKEMGATHQLGGNRLSVDKIPIRVGGNVAGAVVTFKEIDPIKAAQQADQFRKGHFARETFASILGRSDAIARIVEQAQAYSGVDATVLVTGETGVGKEMFAQAIHNHGPRCRGPFVAINCAAIPANLLESELFGYVRGAFTDARREGKIGLFEMADGGTLFLDEISEISLELQAKLLRIIQEKEVMRIGDDRRVSIDVRLIASSNQDLIELINVRKFRSDLYYRINILRLDIPPLRERKGDIELLARYFVEELARKHHREIPTLSAEALALFKTYRWPGNVRELAAVIERSVVTAGGGEIGAADFLGLGRDEVAPLKQRMSREKVLGAMALSGGNKNLAAELLGIDRSTLWRHLKKLSEETTTK